MKNALATTQNPQATTKRPWNNLEHPNYPEHPRNDLATMQNKIKLRTCIIIIM